MRKDSVFDQYEVYVCTAIVAAHSNIHFELKNKNRHLQSQSQGFRQKDVKFLIELFFNWAELIPQINNLQTTQVQRFLNNLVKEGFTRKLSKDKHPTYRLTRVGLIELLKRIVTPNKIIKLEDFLFINYFLENYRPRIEELVKLEGVQFPYALQVELEALFDTKKLLGEQIRLLEMEVKKIQNRIDHGYKSSSLATKLFNLNIELNLIVEEVEKFYPYDLNSQKPLSELISQIPTKTARWELTLGNINRANQLWAPLLKSRMAHLEVLKGFLHGNIAV